MLRFITCLFCLIVPVAQTAKAEITVFAAASLHGVLDEVNETAPVDVTVSYASSAALARQISQGAPADLFISANTRWVDWLETQGDVARLATQDLLRNELVLIGAAEHPEIDIRTLPTLLDDGFLAIGHDRAVPAGIYAKEALTTLGLWADLKGRIIQTDTVRAALRLVALQEAPFAITYVTDAMAEPRVKVLYSFAKESHSPIIYRLAKLKNDPEVSTYLTHLTSGKVREVFRTHGFQDIPE